MKKLSLLLAISFLSGTSFGADPPKFSKALIIEKLKEDLVDPDSAKFRNWSKLKRDFTGYEHYRFVWHGCVEVNAKNRMGGYTGYKTYKYRAFEDGSWG